MPSIVKVGTDSIIAGWVKSGSVSGVVAGCSVWGSGVFSCCVSVEVKARADTTNIDRIIKIRIIFFILCKPFINYFVFI